MKNNLIKSFIQRSSFEKYQILLSLLIIILIAVSIFINVLIPYSKVLYVHAYDTLYGDKIIEDTLSEIIQNETNPDKIALLIMDWEHNYFLNPYSNYNPDSKLNSLGIYNIDGYHLFVRRAPVSWIIHSQLANCEEYAKVFVTLMNEAGYEARFVHSSAGDHCWAEYMHDNYRIAVDPSCNNVIGTHKKEFEKRMNTSFCYIEVVDIEQNKFDVTDEYINTTNLSVSLLKDDIPLDNSKISIYNSYMMDNKRGRYKTPIFIVSKSTDNNGNAFFSLGSNCNYTIRIEDTKFFLFNTVYEQNIVLYQNATNTENIDLSELTPKNDFFFNLLR